MIKIIRWTVTLAGAAALLILLFPLPAAAGGGSTLQSDGQPQPGRIYSGWVEIDVSRRWDAPNPAARLVRNSFELYIFRFRTYLALLPGSGSNPPNSVTIAPHAFRFRATFIQRVEPPEDMPDMCRGSDVTFYGGGEGSTFAGYSGSATGSSTEWRIPGLRFIPADTTPEVTGAGGNCAPGMAPGEAAAQSGFQAEMRILGNTQWSFAEGIRTPRSSAEPDSIEGSCDAPLYGQSGGRIQCSWEVRAGAPRLVPPRRR